MSGSVAVQMDDDDDGGVEITIVDDVPQADRARFVAPDSTDSDDDITVVPSEISQYKTDVQKRIKDLSFKANSERRAKSKRSANAKPRLPTPLGLSPRTTALSITAPTTKPPW